MPSEKVLGSLGFNNKHPNVCTIGIGTLALSLEPIEMGISTAGAPGSRCALNGSTIPM